MVVLDADSVMTGQAVSSLVRLMEVNLRAGIIQTMPKLAKAETVFGRIQQFASRLYAPVFAAGLNFWQQGVGNYWGHNAIIRVSPFLASCGLPVLPGKAPIGGKILSHDFVEAALMLDAGWQVWFAYDLDGSYEELPPNLTEYGQVAVVPSASAGVLLVMTAVLLFGPKVLSVMHLFFRPRELAEFGGPVRVLAGVVLETLFSVLTTPVLIWFHTRFVMKNLEGKTVIWNTQTRGGNAGPRWIDIVREYWPLPLVGAGVAALAWSISPTYLAWLSPLLAGLFLAIPVAKISGDTYLFRKLFLTPEEIRPPIELSSRFELQLRDGDQVIHAVLDPFYNAVHVSLQRERKANSSEQDDYGTSLAAKLFEGGPSVLSAQERRALLADGAALAYLHTLIWKTPALKRPLS